MATYKKIYHMIYSFGIGITVTKEWEFYFIVL